MVGFAVMSIRNGYTEFKFRMLINTQMEINSGFLLETRHNEMGPCLILELARMSQTYRITDSIFMGFISDSDTLGRVGSPEEKPFYRAH